MRDWYNEFVAPYKKAWVAFALGSINTLAQWASTGVFNTTEIVSLATTLLMTIGVYAVENKKKV